MGLTDILHDLKVKFLGFSEDDVYNFIAYPKKSEINKLLRDKQLRSKFFSKVDEIAKKEGLNSEKVLQTVSGYILQKAKDNNLFSSEIFTAPRLQDYELIIGLDELGRYAFGEKDLGMGVVRVIDALDIGKRIRKADPNKFVANVRNAVYIAYQVDKTIERIDKALDVASDLSLVLGLGGLATKGALWLGRRVLKDVAKEALTKSLLLKVANNVATFGIKAGDIAFAGVELNRAVLNTVAKGLPLSYSLDHLIFGALPLVGFLGARTSKAQEVVQRLEGTPYTTIDDVKRAIIENQVPVSGYELNLTADEASKLFVSQVRNYVTERAGKKLSLENLEVFNVIATRLFGNLQGQLKLDTLLVADAFISPHKYVNKIQDVYETVRNFIITNKEKFLELIKGLPEDRLAFVDTEPELFEFFHMNTSKVLVDRVRFLAKKIKEDKIIDPNKMWIRFKDEGIELRYADVYTQEFERLVSDYVEKAIKKEKSHVNVEFLIKEEDETEKLLQEYGLPTIYIPTYDYRKVMVVTVQEGEEIKEVLVDIPTVLIGAFAKSFKNDLNKLEQFLKLYVAQVKNLNPEQVKEILYIYDPVSQLFPSTILRELGFSKLKILDEWLNLFPDKELKEIGLQKGRATQLLEFGKNISEAFNQFAIRQQRIHAEKLLKEIRTQLKEILGYDPKSRVRTETLIKEAMETAVTGGELDLETVYTLAEEVNRLKPLIKDLKAKFTDSQKAGIAEKLTRNLQKVETIIEKLSKNPIEELRGKILDLIYQEKDPRFLRRYGRGFVDVIMLYELDPELAFDYLARAYTRVWTSDKRWLLSFVRRTEERLFTDPFIKDTDFVKTLELIRDYQGRDTPRSKWLRTIGTLSKVYTMFLPRIAIGASIQLLSAISQRYPSFRFFQAPIETIRDIITNPELRNYLYKQIKETLHEHHYLSFWIRSVEPFIQTVFYNELLKNQAFRREVLRDFGHFIMEDELLFTDLKLLAEQLANLIDSPASISPFIGSTFEKLTYIQSWFPYVVAPFQVALHSFAKSLTSPKHAMNFFKHLVIGSTILPATITQFSGVVDTINNAYDGLSTIYHTIASILTGDPEPIQSYLEKHEPVFAKLWKELISNLTDIPKNELTGRLFHDLGLVLALHGDHVAWNYVRAGLDFLAKHIDLANKGLFSPGSVSTSFEVTVPLINTAIKLINSLTVYEKEQPQQAGRTLLETIVQMVPIAKNIKSGILNELTQYGRVNEESILRYFTDPELAQATGLGYFLGVMIKHPVTVAKIFDTMFLGGLGEAVGRVFTGEEKKILFLPKVTDTKSYRLKILDNEEYVLQSLRQIEDSLTKKNFLLRVANIMDSYFDEKKAKKTDRTPEEEINMFKSYLTFLVYDPSILDDTELEYMVNVANKSAYYFKIKYGLEEKDLHQFLAKALDELKIRKKLKK